MRAASLSAANDIAKAPEAALLRSEAAKTGAGQGSPRQLEPGQDGGLKAVQYRVMMRALGSLDAKHLSECFNLKVLCQQPYCKVYSILFLIN